MSRLFRLYEKKRGHRRTGSNALGNFGEALFFGLFLVLGGVVLAAMFAILVWPEWRANRQFAETQCEVVDKQVGVKPATVSEPAKYRPEITIRYSVDGRQYEITTYEVTHSYSPDKETVQATVARFEIGQQYACWYDPIHPGMAVLARGYSGWLYLLLLIPISSITIGGGGLIYTMIHWSASAERRALRARQRAVSLDVFDQETAQNEFPNVPADANLTNSPGTKLKYRLPISTTTSWTLFATSAVCLLWNGIVAIFVTMAVQGHTRGEPNWVLTAFVVPFVLAGIGLIVYWIRQFLLTTGVGPTRLEVSNHPLAPAGEYELFLAQAGRLTINSLELWLVCDETATYRQGTDTRTETRRVYEERCFVRERIEIQQGVPFESRCHVLIPAAAMHSFQSNHNHVSWRLVVKGNVVGWPEYQRVFPVVINPGANGQSHR